MSAGTCTTACESNARAGSVLSGVSTVTAPDEWIEPQPAATPTTPMQTPKITSPPKTEDPLSEGWKSSKFADPAKPGTR